MRNYKLHKEIPKLLIIIIFIGILSSCRQSNKNTNDSKQLPIAELSVDSAFVFLPEIVSLPNSEEFGITFNPDMTTLFFTSKREGDENYYIYTSEFKNGQWQQAEVAPFSGEYFDADAFMSPNGKTLYFFSMRPKSDDTASLKMPNIWNTENRDGSWTNPRLAEGQLNSDTSGEGYLSITNDFKMYFSSVGRNEPSGKHDIFMSEFIQGKFNIPAYVNIDIEASFSNPFIFPDEDYLIIDSKKEGGFGGSDLYISKRTGQNEWLSPRNLGPLVNTASEEGTPNLSPDGRWFFFSRGGDIFYINKGALNLK